MKEKNDTLFNHHVNNKMHNKTRKKMHENKNKQSQHIYFDGEDDESKDIQKKWFEVHNEVSVNTAEEIDTKDSKLQELHNICRSAFEQAKLALEKNNRKDVSWLQTALRKGTAKDRVNAGALLVSSNPLANLDALDQLISFTKFSNKASTEVLSIVVDTWKDILLPPDRKLYSLEMRCANFKAICTNDTMSNEQKREIYAYWYFEAELKERYSEFLRNIQQALQNGQEINKTTSIGAASLLLIHAPEKENMLLSMLINKLGDPVSKVAAKALHHLIDIANKHPNMCIIIVNETEKLLFRNNISERAQHFGLCYLGTIASLGRSEVCTKLVNVCFALFKVLVQKGSVNNRTMQAILRCLQKAIAQSNAIQEKHNNNSDHNRNHDNESTLLSADMLDTMYRLVHLADIHISIQTLGLLLQLQTGRNQKGDRFYNALYAKLLDMNVMMIGIKTAAQFLHIIHRAVHIDANVLRAKAFIKRLLQMAIYVPSNVTAGCLIVIHKLLSSRKELSWWRKNRKQTLVTDESEETNHNETTLKEQTEPAKGGQLNVNNEKEQQAYNPYHRVPKYCGIQFTTNSELLLLHKHFHPTIQVFTENILNNKKINYYGDPLRDFGLSHFLERFSFKNPKKNFDNKTDNPSIPHIYKHYKSIGSRGLPVKMLTKKNCTEDEMYIFNYLEMKRQKLLDYQIKEKQNNDNQDDDDNIKTFDVNDDEFDEYLDNYFKKKTKGALHEDEEELDFMKELGDELGSNLAKQKNKKKKQSDSADVDDFDADWDDNNDIDYDDGDGDDDDDDDEQSHNGSDGNDNDDEDFMSLDEMNEDDIENSESDFESDLESDTEKYNVPKLNTKRKRSSAPCMDLDDRTFSKKLKHTTDMSSLFTAADDFGELLKETGKMKHQGTINAISNKDKASEKQLKWEEKRHSNKKIFSRNTNKKGKKVASKSKILQRKKIK